MKRFSRWRPSPALAVACLALFVAMGGAAYAAATIGSADIIDDSIRSRDVRNEDLRGRDIADSSLGTSDVINDSLRGRDVRRDSLDGTDINEDSLGTVPDAAKLGGIVAGDYTRRLFAVVDLNGAFVRGAGVTSAQRIGAGRYQVVFNRSVTGCSYGASGGSITTSEPPQTIAVTAQRAGNPNAVFVGTRDDANTFVDRSFHLQVVC
ncbi:MAG: hypothetical protein ACM3UV_04130 [Nocardioidaceae bacterium]